MFSIFLIAYDNINRPDAGLYHYPFMKILNEHKIILGSANLHFRFGHTSLIQYLSAGYNNYFFKENGMLIPIALIFYSSSKYFYDKIKFYKNKNNIICFFSFLILFQILFDMNRYSGFGNDVPAHLIIFIACFYFLEKNIIKYDDFFYLSLMTIFAFQIKSTMLVVFIIPLYLLIKNYEFIKQKKNFLIFLIISIWFIKNFLISGCLLFPVDSTCSKKVLWSTSKFDNINSPNRISEENEAWAKAWPNRENPKLSYSNFLKEGWISTWAKSHGKIVVLKKISFLLIILILITFLKKNKINDLRSKHYLNKFILLLIVGAAGTALWFFKFPTYRYGASYIIIFLISVIIILNINKSFKKLIKIIPSIIVLLFSFIIIKYVKKFDNKNSFFPEIYTFEKKVNNSKNKSISLEKIFKNNEFSHYTTNDQYLCMYMSSPCTNIMTDPLLNQKKIANYKIFYLDDK